MVQRLQLRTNMVSLLSLVRGRVHCLLTTCSKMTDVYEGSLIRLFRRLEELLRQISNAAKIMGSPDLEEKFEVALKKLTRDIVAAQSLYL